MINILLAILEKVIKNISPEIREKMLELMKDLEAAAEKTPNPLDDIFVLILRILLGF